MDHHWCPGSCKLTIRKNSDNHSRIILKIKLRQQWCNWAFPPGKYNSIPPTPDLDRYNKYGGVNLRADRLAFIDGGKFLFILSHVKLKHTERSLDSDVWLDLCYHSNLAPPRHSSDLHPEYLIAGGGHHWDSYGILDLSAEPQYIQQAHLWEIRTVQKWLKSWNSTKGFR